MARRRRSRVAPIVAVLAPLALLVAPALPGAAGGRVVAHAQLVTSSPASGEVLDAAPSELRLVFSEPLESEATSLDVRDRDGTAIVQRAGTPDPADPFSLVARLPALPDGTYTVTWRTLSAADGHTVEGSFSFGVGDVTVAPGAATTSHGRTDMLDVLGRLASYVGLLAAVGAAAWTAAVVRRGPMVPPLRRLVAAILLVGGIVTFATAIANAAAAGDVVPYLLGSRNGVLQAARAAVAVAGAALLVTVPAATATAVAAAVGLTGIGLLVAAGHAAALPGPVPLIVGTIHVAAAGVWLGGVAGLVALTWRPSLVAADPAPSPRKVVPRFSALALVSIGLAGTSGVVAAWWHTGVLVDPASDYGRTLVTKSALAAAAIALGAVNYLDGGRLLGTVGGLVTRTRVEALLGVAVLAVTAVLATTSPNDGRGGVAVTPVPDAFGALSPGVTFELAPGRPGVNRAVVETSAALAMSGTRLALVLDRLDDGTTTRIELHHPEMAPMERMDGMAGHGMAADGDDSTAWTADAVVLPPGSRWDANVLTLTADGTELGRQRYAFTMTDDGIGDGRVRTIVTPASVAAVVLVLAGGIGIGLALGGGPLPRCDARASAVALRVGGAISLLLGVALGTDIVLRL